MDKPYCKICKGKHWGSEDHVWPEEPRDEEPVRVTPPTSESPMVKPKFDRIAYQREYMRKRRKKS